MIAKNQGFVNPNPDGSGISTVSDLMTWVNDTLDLDESTLVYPPPLTLENGTVIDPRNMRRSVLVMRSMMPSKKMIAPFHLVDHPDRETYWRGLVQEAEDIATLELGEELDIDAPPEDPPVDTDVWMDEELDVGLRVVISASRGILMIREREGKNGPEFNCEKVSKFPLIPIELLTSTGNVTGCKETYVKVRFLSVIGKIEEIVMSLDAFMSPRSTEFKRECVRAGYALPDHQAKNFSEVMTELIAASHLRKDQGFVVVKEGRGACGWYNGEHYTPGSSGYAGPIPDMAVKRGNPEVWRSVMRDVFNHSPALSIGISAAFGGYMRGLVPDVTTNSILHFWSPNGNRGKTTLLEILCSIQGEPSRTGKAPIADAASTAVGLERFLSSCNNGFFCVDEINGLLAQRDPVKILMDITNGGGRAKAGQDESLKRGLTYMLQVFSNGNGPILDSSLLTGHMQEKTLYTRIMELNIDEGQYPLFVGDAQEINAFTGRVKGQLEQNHGHGYDLAIQYIKDNKDDLVMTQQAYTNKLIPLMPANADTRRAKDLSFIAVGMMIARYVLDLSDAEYESGYRRFTDFIAQYHSRGESVEEVHQNHFDHLKSFVFAHVARFAATGYLHPDFVEDKVSVADSDYARVHTQKALTRPPLFGLIEQPDRMRDVNDFNGAIYINRKASEQDARKFGIDLTEIARIARGNHWLIQNSSDIKQGRLFTRKNGMDCYGFDLAKYLAQQEKAAETEADPYDLLTAEDFSDNEEPLVDEPGANG